MYPTGDPLGPSTGAATTMRPRFVSPNTLCKALFPALSELLLQPSAVKCGRTSVKIELLLLEETRPLLPGKERRYRLSMGPVSDGEPVSHAHGDPDVALALMFCRYEGVPALYQPENGRAARFLRKAGEDRLGEAWRAHVVEHLSGKRNETRAERIPFPTPFRLTSPNRRSVSNMEKALLL